MNTKLAVTYLRTSSAANIGDDKDSEARQRRAVHNYADAHDIEIVGEFTDPGVSGADAIESRPGFSALLDRIEGNGVRLVLVEDVSRLARTMLAQENGILALATRKITVVTASGENLTETDDPTKVMLRQVATAFAQYEKSRLVAKLKAARDRKLKATGWCGGSPLVPQEVVEAAKALSANGLSLRRVADRLAETGHLAAGGKVYSAQTVKRMLARE